MFFLFLTSLCIRDSSFLHLTAKLKFGPFLWLSNIPLYKCAKTSLSIHLLMEPVCFHVLDIVNIASMNSGVHVTFRIMAFSGYMPSSGVAGWHSTFILTFFLFLFFQEISILLSIVAISIYIPTNCTRGFPFLHMLSSIYCL